MSSVRLIIPYAVWMVLMTALPSVIPEPATAYAVRVVATAVALAACVRGAFAAFDVRTFARSLAVGVPAGLLVFAIWVLPEYFEWYREWCVVGDETIVAASPYDPRVCGWALFAIRLAGSAFVISAAEEMFFRKWLVRFAGFWWMVLLFAIEHDRPLVAAVAGVIYGLVYIRYGLASAIVAHAVTNLALGIYVVKTGAWGFW